MGRWVRSNPALGSGDLSHLTHHGHKVVGGLLYRALVAGYVDYRKRMVGAPVSLPRPAAPEQAPVVPEPTAAPAAPASATPGSTAPTPAVNGPAPAAGEGSKAADP